MYRKQPFGNLFDTSTEQEHQCYGSNTDVLYISGLLKDVKFRVQFTKLGSLTQVAGCTVVFITLPI